MRSAFAALLLLLVSEVAEADEYPRCYSESKGFGECDICTILPTEGTDDQVPELAVFLQVERWQFGQNGFRREGVFVVAACRELAIPVDPGIVRLSIRFRWLDVHFSPIGAWEYIKHVDCF